MLKSQKFKLIMLGCVGLLGAILLASILVMQSSLPVTHVGVGKATSVANIQTVNFSANFIDQILDWIGQQETWVLFFVVMGSAIVVIFIIWMIAYIIYKFFFSKRKSRDGGYSADFNALDEGDFVAPPRFESSNPVPPSASSAVYDVANLPSFDQPLQLDVQQLPDMTTIHNASAPSSGEARVYGNNRVNKAMQQKVGFDLNTPFVSQRKIASDAETLSPADLIQMRIEEIKGEREVIEDRLVRVGEEYNLLKAQYDSSVAQAEKDIVEMQDEIADLQDWLHQAPKKEKDRIIADIEAREVAIGEAYSHISNLTDPNSGAAADLAVLKLAQSNLYQAKIENEEELVKAKADLQMLHMREELEAPERERERQEKVNRLRGIMQEVNQLQAEEDVFEEKLAKRNKEKELLKTENITLQHAIMSTVDLEEVVSVSQRIQSNNQAIMELDKKNNEDLRNRTVRPASLSKLKRDADDLILELKLSYNEVVKEEDEVLIDVTRQSMIDEINESKRVAQDLMIRSQHKHDTFTQDYHRNLTDAAFDISNAMREAENEVVAASDRLKSIIDKLAKATGTQANLLTIDRLAAEDAVQIAKVALERVKAQGIKDRIAAKTKLDNDIIEAAKEVDRARREYDTLIAKQRNIDSEAKYAVISGSGVISKMRKEYESLEKEKEKERRRIKEEFEKRQAELIGERERLGEEASLETRLQMALQQDVIKAQKGDKEAKTRLEHHLTSKMHADEKELFDVMRPDEKWRFIVMEVEELIRRTRQTSREKLSAIAAEEEALLAKLEADERVRQVEASAEEARRKMESQIAQSQIDADYARLQSVDSMIAAKELAEKQAEELMRVAYEERRKANELVEAVKQRSLEAKRLAEEIVGNFKGGNLEDEDINNPQSIADSNMQFNNIVEQAMHGQNDLDLDMSLLKSDPTKMLGDQSDSLDLVNQMLDEAISQKQEPPIVEDVQQPLPEPTEQVQPSLEPDIQFQPQQPSFNQPSFAQDSLQSTFVEMPIDNNNVIYNQAPIDNGEVHYSGPIHSKSDFDNDTNMQYSYNQMDAEINAAAQDLEFAKSDLARAKQVAQFSVKPFDNGGNVPFEQQPKFLPNQKSQIDPAEMEAQILAKLEAKFQEEEKRREEQERLRVLEEEQKKLDDARQKQLDEELEKIKGLRQKIELEQAQQKLMMEEKIRESQQIEKPNNMQQQAIDFEKQSLNAEKQALEAQRRAIEEEKKAIENERLIKEQIEETKRQFKEERDRIENERQKQIEEANKEVDRLKLELLEERQREEMRKIEERQKEELRKVEEEKQLQVAAVAKQVEYLRQQMLQEQQNVEHYKNLQQQQQEDQELIQTAQIADEESEILQLLEQEKQELEEEMRRASYIVDESSLKLLRPESGVRDHVYTVASDIRRMAKDAAAQAIKQAQDAKEEAEKVRQAMEQEILRVRQEIESSKKVTELESHYAAIESKAQEEVRQAQERAERAEALAKQTQLAEASTVQKVEEAILAARKAAEEAINDAVKQSKDANAMVETIKAQADLEVNQLKKELQKELQELKQERDREIGQRVEEYEKALRNAELAASSRAEKAESAFRELELATQRAIQENERRAEQTLKEVQEKANQHAKEAEEKAMQLAKQAEEKAMLLAKAAEEKALLEAKIAKEQSEQKAKEAQEKAEALAREAQEKADKLAREAQEKADRLAREAQENADKKAKEAQDRAELIAKEAQEKLAQQTYQLKEQEEKAKIAAKEADEKRARIRAKINAKKHEIASLRERIAHIKNEADVTSVIDRLNIMSQFLDEDEKASVELQDLIQRTAMDARHSGEIAMLRTKLDETSSVATQPNDNLLPPPLRRPRQPLRRRPAPTSRAMRPMRRRPSVRNARPTGRPAARTGRARPPR